MVTVSVSFTDALRRVQAKSPLKESARSGELSTVHVIGSRCAGELIELVYCVCGGPTLATVALVIKVT